MDTAWIQVFVLTVSECVAPSGESMCAQHEYQLEFATAEACKTVEHELVLMKAEMPNVILDRERTRCAPSTRRQPVFATLAEAQEAMGSRVQMAPARQPEKALDFTQKAHKERLATLPTCEEARGRSPCKVGEIIVESGPIRRAEVWQRDDETGRDD